MHLFSFFGWLSRIGPGRRSSIRTPRRSKYTGRVLRKLRAVKGVGRPPGEWELRLIKYLQQVPA